MTSAQPVEIGWKKDLLTNNVQDSISDLSSKNSNKRVHRRSRSESSSSDGSSGSSSTSTSRSSSSSKNDSKRKKKSVKKDRKEKRKEEKKLKKAQKKLEKVQRREAKKAKKEKHREEKKLKKLSKKQGRNDSIVLLQDAVETDCSVPIDLMISKVRVPQSREEYEAKQKIIRKVVDPETGRTRIIKGDGEILEEIVTKDRHKNINRNATRCDGEFFQSKTVGWNLD